MMDMPLWWKLVSSHCNCCSFPDPFAAFRELTACLFCLQVRKLAGDVTDKLSAVQSSFRRSLTADAKAFKGDAVLFR